MSDEQLYAVALNRFQIDFLLKFCDGILKTPSVRFSKNPQKRDLMQSVSDLQAVLKYSLESGPME